MATVTAVVSSLADNDRFLPRYLTAQLLRLLAKAWPKPESANTTNSEGAAKLIDLYKNSDLFNPLTASIFLRQDSQAILAENSITLDDLDKSNRSPLTLAIANEDFALAVQLIEKDATIFLEDKLVLEIALTSMLQRDKELLSKILTIADEHDKKWLSEYFNHLSDNLSGKPSDDKSQYREVLNPTIRQFGQALDTLVYFNGIPSHYGFIGPSLDLLTKQLLNSGEELSQIARAFDFTRKTCKFLGNLATNPDAAKELSSQISNNMRGNSFSPVVIFGGWAGTCVALAFVKNHLVVSDFGSKIFMINNPAAISSEMIETFINGLGKASSATEILGLLGTIVDAKPIFTLQQESNSIDNCIFVNPRAVIQGALLVHNCYVQNGNVTADSLQSISARVADIYNNFVTFLYKAAIHELANYMRNNNLYKNKRVECCSLALEYINQHYNDPTALQLCIELKNALEFVGLKNLYDLNIQPEAQRKIQDQIIRNQEITAVEVINLENAMLAKQK